MEFVRRTVFLVERELQVMMIREVVVVSFELLSLSFATLTCSVSVGPFLVLKHIRSP